MPRSSADTIDESQPPLATLVITDPEGQRHRFDITSDRTSFGRVKSNDIAINDPAISSHHCEFLADDKGITIRDLGSSNGTFLNQKRVSEARLRDGDLLRVGQCQVRVNMGKKGAAAGASASKGGSNATVYAVVAVAAVLVIAIAAVVIIKTRGGANAKKVERYEQMARSMLKDDPCSLVDDQAKQLAKLDDDLAQVRLRFDSPRGKKLKVDQATREAGLRLIQAARQKSPLFTRMIGEVSGYVDGQRAQASRLSSQGARLSSDDLKSTAKELDKAFQKRLESAGEFQAQLKAAAADVQDFAKNLEAAIVRGLPDVVPKLNADLPNFGTKVKPRDLVDTCKANFAKTQTEALDRLAQMDAS